MREKTMDGDKYKQFTIWAGRVQSDRNHNKWFDPIAELQYLLSSLLKLSLPLNVFCVLVMKLRDLKSEVILDLRQVLFI